MNDIGHQMLYGELLPFVTEMEDEKAIIRQDAVYTIATREMWFQNFGMELSMANIDLFTIRKIQLWKVSLSLRKNKIRVGGY